MQVYVKAAHSFVRYHLLREVISQNIIKNSDSIEPSLVVPALRVALEPSKDMVDHNVEDSICMMDPIFDDRCSAKDRYIIQSCVYSGLSKEDIRPSVGLRVEPSLKVGSLKSVLKREPWAPKENIVLFRNMEKPLEDEGSTLEECGVKDHDTLFACMGGSFEITVSYINGTEDFVIPVHSCFDTVGHLKDTIHQKTGHPPEDQELYINMRTLLNEDRIPLVAAGIVRPYLPEMLTKVYLVIPKKVESFPVRWDTFLLGD